MKPLLCAAAVLALFTPQVALAQRHDNGNGRGGGNHQSARPQRQQAQRQNVQRQQVVRQQAARQERQQVRTETRTTRTMQVQRSAPAARQQVRNVRTTTRVTSNVNRTQRAAGYRPAHVQRVRASAYRYPRGYSYRRWNRGSILPRLFLSSAYYYTNWYDLGFGPPPPGYQWVRYGPDLLLVNVYSGRIRDVAYNVFY